MVEINDEAHRELRLILERQYEYSVACQELKEIGDELIDFFEIIVAMDTERQNEMAIEGRNLYE